MEKETIYCLSEKEREAFSIVISVFAEICNKHYSCHDCPFYRDNTCGTNTVVEAFREQL